MALKNKVLVVFSVVLGLVAAQAQANNEVNPADYVVTLTNSDSGWPVKMKVSRLAIGPTADYELPCTTGYNSESSLHVSCGVVGVSYYYFAGSFNSRPKAGQTNVGTLVLTDYPGEAASAQFDVTCVRDAQDPVRAPTVCKAN